MKSTQEPLRIPLWKVNPQFDNDHPNYKGGDPSTYLLSALCYDSLAGPSTCLDRDGIISPDILAMKPRLAEAFGENGDGTWWVRLRRGVLSHWGNELTAESVQWGFRKAFAVGNLGKWRWSQIAGIRDPQDVEPLDKYTLRYTLRRPNTHFPAYLFFVTPNVVDATEVSKHTTENDPWGMEWLSRNVAGFGPFALVDFKGDQMVMRARNEYWDGPPPVREVVVEKVSSRAEAIRMLDRPEPVLLVGLRCDEVQQIRDRSNVRLIGTWAGHTSVEINYNTPPFDDIRVRHALSFATPYEEILQKGFLGLARPWKSALKTYSPWYTDQFWNYDTNMGKAKSLLRQAGHSGGLKTQLYIPQRSDMLRIAEMLKIAYGLIGVDVEVEDMASAPRGWVPPLRLRPECAHDLTEPLYDLAHDYAPLNPILPAPGGPKFLPLYVGNGALEDGFREMLLAPDKESRKELCLALQKAIVEFAPCIFLAETPLFNASNSQAHSWTADYDNRLVQKTLFSNSNTRYLSP